MSDDGFPSMTALLGLLAIAGYQNRDRIGELLGIGGHGQAPASQPQPNLAAPPPPQQPGGFGGVLGTLAGSGGSGGSFLNGGIGQLIDSFSRSGHGDIARSWVGQGPNQPIAPTQLEQAIGPDVLATLGQRTGLSREDLLARLSKTLPQAVDQYTPDGQIPS
jgi:uncharacterized protein YidB (DUF937 family)